MCMILNMMDGYSVDILSWVNLLRIILDILWLFQKMAILLPSELFIIMVMERTLAMFGFLNGIPEYWNHDGNSLDLILMEKVTKI